MKKTMIALAALATLSAAPAAFACYGEFCPETYEASYAAGGATNFNGNWADKYGPNQFDFGSDNYSGGGGFAYGNAWFDVTNQNFFYDSRHLSGPKGEASFGTMTDNWAEIWGTANSYCPIADATFDMEHGAQANVNIGKHQFDSSLGANNDVSFHGSGFTGAHAGQVTHDRLDVDHINGWSSTTVDTGAYIGNGGMYPQ